MEADSIEQPIVSNPVDRFAQLDPIDTRVEPGISMSIIELIAVIALRNDLILLTTDQDFRTVPRLEQENWLAV